MIRTSTCFRGLWVVGCLGGLAGCGAAGPSSPARDVRSFGSTSLVLPGASRPEIVHYEVVDGIAVMEGDIVLGPEHELASAYGAPLSARYPNAHHAMGVEEKSWLWPGGQIPYEVDGSISPSLRMSIEWAVQQANQAGLRVRPRLPIDADYVVFKNPGEGCNSHIGRRGGPQTINLLEACGRGGALHEIMHAAGFFHEQSRSDRDAFITIMWDDIQPGSRSAFERRDSLGKDIGPYDYDSLMHYGERAFSRTGNPTIVPKVPTVRIGQRERLSELDRAGVAHLYGSGDGVGFPSIPGFPELPVSWPTSLPSSLPYGFPTTLPSTLPGGLPVAIPSLPLPPELGLPQLPMAQ